MRRYKKTRILNDRNNERYLSTRTYKPIPKQDTDIYIIGKIGQTLINLADTYYNDVDMWWVIATANPGCFEGGVNLKVGKEYRIPTDLSVVGLDVVNRGTSGGGGGGY